MPTDEAALLQDLATLGLDARSFRAVALLPLVEVAWADHEVQLQERKHILEIAKGHGLLSGRGALALDRWLSSRPSEDELALGRSVLVRLAHSTDGIGADLPEDSLQTVVEMCAQVAEAAGGLFGLFQRVSAEERATIRAIADAIEQHSSDVRDTKPAQAGGATLDDAWKDLLDEVATRDEIRLDDLEAQARAQGVTGSPPEPGER